MKAILSLKSPSPNPDACRSGLWRACGTVLLACLVLAFGPVLEGVETSNPDSFRIGVSYASFGTVSRNDAGAALKAWAIAVRTERKLSASVQVEVFDHASELCDAVERQAVDAASMTAEEFLRSGQNPEELIVSARSKGFTEQYVIVTHARGAIDDVAALKGCKLVRPISPIMSVSWPWLETLLASRGLEPTTRFFGQVITLANPSKAVLQVFFRQAHACLVTTNAFELACELNPQLRRDLKVLAVSPPLIPNFFFRPGYTSPARQDLEAAILDLHSTAAGQQVLTVFQGVRMEKHPASCLETTRQLLADHRRFCPPTNHTRPDSLTAIPPRTEGVEP